MSSPQSGSASEQPQQDPSESALETHTTPMRRSRGRLLALLVMALAAAAALTVGLVPRLHGQKVLQERVQATQIPIVNVVAPRNGAQAYDIVLPADVRAYEDTAIHARVSGYLRRWYVDIGTPVKAGQLLADIDVPEIADQLRQARATEATASAEYDLARTTALRWKALQATNSVAQQDTDQKVADMNAKAALLSAAHANTARLAQLTSFAQIRAPFDGVVTQRNVDTGALVDAGSGTGQGPELFHLSAGSRLRVYAEVPQDISAALEPGTKAWLTLPQSPAKRYPATVARTAGAINPVTRSLRVELDVDSQEVEILPGTYAEVHLVIANPHAGLDVPANTLRFGKDGAAVLIVDDQDRLATRRVTLGRDYGSHVEILAGLQGNERLVTNPGDGLVAGATVRVASAVKAKGAPA
ncbi:efflux RND transporter periplasmic adaptor subunit [Cupriavidus sp. 2SB]|uniref:efflux RND transporter periplasmic adaptor subunit n=1 Tax=Cupriavidus sp. 2SB TaxID=2502199 RepID=UPI0032D5A65C